ncbi:hypothetical protein EDD22DRAFT_163627 [Suillus occidentalis]|nr:hypothetical protein EDD22DRAFT_163627 [Suillus occidentalis]
MYSKFISVAFVLAATLAPSAVALPRGNVVDARDDPKIATVSPMITPTVTPTLATPTPTRTTSTTPTTSIATSPITPSSIVTPPALPSSTLTPSTTITPIPNPSETAKRQSGSASTSTCNEVLPWQVNLAYSSGAQVTFKNQLWTANQWNYNSNPDSAAGAWTLNGVCNPSVTPKDCSKVVAWNRGTAYPGGSSVTFNGHLWTSTQWTSSNSPGDTSGTWKDQGACA